jgi:hypothetical protein
MLAPVRVIITTNIDIQNESGPSSLRLRDILLSDPTALFEL